MKTYIGKDKDDMALKAAACAAEHIRKAIAERGEARIIVATGANQFEFLNALVNEPDIDWTKVTGFHLDEYVGLSVEHPASFRNYMRKRFVAKTPQPMKVFNEVNGEAAEPQAEIDRLEALIRTSPIDVACVGIGENGHLAFNDPPADFETKEAYIIVNLDERCKQQQLGEGWFSTINDVPKQAVSMTPHQIMQCERIVSCVPYAVKAEAVENTVKAKATTNMVPATLLKEHKDFILYLDEDSAAGILK